MLKYAALTIALSLTGTIAVADAPRDQLLANVTRDLPDYVTGVDPATLSRAQLAAIYVIIYDGHSDGEKRRLIRSTIGGRLSLRGLLFN